MTIGFWMFVLLATVCSMLGMILGCAILFFVFTRHKVMAWYMTYTMKKGTEISELVFKENENEKEDEQWVF